MEPAMSYNPDNVFAKILRGELPCFKIYEDEHSLAFMDIMPQADGHALVIPKVPAETLAELPLDYAQPLLSTVQKVLAAQKQALGAEGVVLMQLNGTQAGQTVPHLHFHLIPAHLSKLKAHGAEQGDMAQIKALAERLAAVLQ
jgi:histidine triad (HIT) family protein